MGDQEKAKQNRAKIIVGAEDELTDLLRKISALEDENILLTFAENSDLLVSPINLKVIQEVCDDFKKNLILQIIQNPAGIRNAQLAGILATKSPSDVDDELWVASREKRIEREEARKSSLSSSQKDDVEIQQVMDNLEDKSNPVIQDSEYQERIQQVIAKSKGLVENEHKKIIEGDGLTFAVGQDIDETQMDSQITPKKEQNLIGRNFNNINELKKIGENKRGILSKPFKKEQDKDDSSTGEVAKPKMDKKKLKKGIIIGSVALIVALGLFSIIAYYTMPRVSADIYIESRSIEVEKILKGSPNITSLDLNAGEIPVKQEEITVSRSDHADTTGTGVRGEKAEGVVSLKYWDGDETQVPAGTTISTNGLAFEITRTVDIPEAPSTTPDIPVRAAEPGSDYNLSAGQIFSVSGFGEELTAENGSSFSGGLSEEYSKLTQEDYDDLAETLKDDAFEDGMRQLEERNPEWKLLEESINQELDGDITTDIPVGAEGHLFNMNLSTITTGLYYNKDEIVEAQEEIIKQIARERDLFNADGDLDLELDEDIETDISIEEIDGNNITVKFTAKGQIRVNVDTEQIQEELRGKSWEEGVEILEEMDYTEKAPEISFTPEYFPEFLWHFPSNPDKILIETKLVETETIREEDDGDAEESE